MTMARCSVVHALPGRVRLHAPGLRGNSQMARMIQAGIEARLPRCQALPDVRSGRVLVTWDETLVMPEAGDADIQQTILQLADRLLVSAEPDAVQPGVSDLARGLDGREAQHRLSHYGPNTLPAVSRTPWWQLALQQFRDPMTIAFGSVAGLSFLSRRVYDGLAMVAVIGLNAVVAVGQEIRLQREAKGLQGLQTPVAVVVRGGVEQTIPASAVVPGDVLLLTAGDRVAADGIVTLSSYLEVDESCLTGESVPVAKHPPEHGVQGFAQATQGAGGTGTDHKVFLGTLVTRGRARVLVTTTGAHTEMGRIADSLAQAEVPLTPLQLRLRTLGRLLVAGIVVTVGAVVTVGLWRGLPARSLFMTGLTLAASAIPEGLPVLITIGLTAGVRRVGQRKAMIRRLSALETLGRTTVICSDKTGTLTQNQMTVRQVYAGGVTWQVTGNGYDTKGDAIPDTASPQALTDLRALARHAVLCSDATLTLGASGEDPGAPAGATGDPTEAALLVFAHKVSVQPHKERERMMRVCETPFSSSLRKMSVLCADAAMREPALVIVKGAVEEILARCTHHLVDGQAQMLGMREREVILRRAATFAGHALRVLAVAHRTVPAEGELAPLACGLREVPIEFEKGLVFSGLLAMIDPPRPFVKESLARCRAGGIRVVMITGDHPQTALAIARQIGLPAQPQMVLTGQQIDQMSAAELAQRAEQVSLYARVSPHHKLAIVRALQAAGNVVAMTGDGVNDAPAIKRADVGIAMGKTGTEVAKEASALTLADDNFVTILEAVKEGRGVLGNIRRAVGYLLSGNIGEVLFAAFAIVLGMPLPLVPVQILLVNLLTDAVPTLALLTQARPQEAPDAELQPLDDLTDGPYLRRIVTRGVVIALSALTVFATGLRVFGSPEIARTMAMVSLIGAELLQMGIWSGDGNQVRGGGVAPTRPLHLTALVSLAVLLCTIYVPSLARIAHTVALPLQGLLIAAGGALVLPLARLATHKSHAALQLGAG